MTSVPGPPMPPLPRWHLPRQRLLDLVPADAAVVCVTAGAGWGKTVLLREIAQHILDRGDPVAWVALPASDTDRARCWSEIAGAIGAARPRPDGDAAPDAEPDGAHDMASVLRALTDVSTRGRRLAIVLDDVHHLRDPDVRADLARFAQRLPRGVRLLVASRRPPAGLFGAVATPDHVVHLGRDDLRHTIHEVRALMGVALGPDIGDEMVTAVMDDSEGWPALVRLHAIAAMRGTRADDAGGIRQLARRAVEEHVLDQVLGPLPADLRSFALDISVLDVLTIEGCDAVAGRSATGDALDRLAEHGVPLEAIDARRRALRLHGAVRTVARAELARRDRDHWHDVHHRAASYLERAGAPVEAVDHLLEISDHVAAVEVLVGAHRSIARSVSRRPLAERMARFPVASSRSDPRVAFDVALLDALSGRFASAARTVAALRQVDLADDLRQDRTTVELAIGGLLGDIDQLIALGDATVGAEPQMVADAPANALPRSPVAPDIDASATLRADIWPAAPVALVLADRFPECEAACRRAERTGSTLWADPATNLGARALLSAWRGRLREAAPAVEAARRHQEAGGAPDAPTSVRLETAELLLRLEAGDPAGVAAAALQLLADLAADCERHTTLDVPIAVIALRAWRVAGEPSRAFDGSVPLVTTTPAIARPWLTSLIAEELVRSACALGDPGGIAAAERALGHVRGPLATTLARAHVLVARHETTAARSVLTRLDLHQIAQHSPARAIDLGVLQHRTATTSRELAGALFTVRAIAEQHAMLGTLDTVLGQGARSAGSSATAPCDDLREPLTSRELEVLRLLPTDLPTAELAAQLFVSVNTIKTHMKSVYRKLGADGRVDAVRRGREFGVLAPRP